MWILITLTLTGLTLKLCAIYLCYRGWRHYRKHWHMAETGFCITFSGLVSGEIAIEFYSYFSAYHPSAFTIDAELIILKLFYILAFAILLWLPIVIDIVIFRTSGISKSVFLATIWAVITILFVSTDLFITGVKPLPQGFTRVPGPYYGVIIIAMATPICYSILKLIKIARHTHNELVRTKTFNILIGVTLLAIMMLTVAILMALNVTINAAGLFSFSMGVLLLILAMQFNHARLIDLRAFIPGTNKWRMLWRQTRHIHTLSVDPAHYKGLIDDYTGSVIEAAEKVCETQREVADYTGVSQATVSRRVRKSGEHKVSNME